MADGTAALSTRGAVSLPADKIRSVHQKIRAAFGTEFPTEKLSFQEPDDVVSNCNGTVMTVDVWPIFELTPAKNETLKSRLRGIGGSVDIWPTSHPSRGGCIRVAWNSGGCAGDGGDGSQNMFASYTLAMVILVVVFVVVWVRLVPASWKLNTLESILPGSREYILKVLRWVGNILPKRTPDVVA